MGKAITSISTNMPILIVNLKSLKYIG